MSGLRAVLRVADAGSGVGWTRLCDYTEPVTGELARREPAVAGVPLILSWSGTLTVDGLRTRALCPDTVPPVVAGAAALLNRHRGRLGAAELAQRLGYGRQYVHRQPPGHLGD